MTEIVADGQPFEAPLAAADQGYANTPPTFSRAFGAMFEQLSPVEALNRAAERGQYAGASWFDRSLVQIGEAQASQADPSITVDSGIATPTLSAADANKRYAPPGTTITDHPVPEGIARVIGQAKEAEIERESVLRRFSQAHSWPVTFGTNAAAFILDPLNASTAFLPGIGEETAMTGLGRIGLGSGMLARTGARIAAGGASGALAQAPLSTMRYGLGREEASDYDTREAFQDMAYSAAGGAAFHAGFGAIGDAISPRTVPDVQLGLVRNLERSADDAVSPKGAIGRYQVMPDTAREYGFDPARLRDPTYNEQVARTVLADLDKRFNSDAEAVLVAYNAGPGRAEAWLKAGRDDSVLPAETRAYLARAQRMGGSPDMTGLAADAGTKADAMRAAISQVTDGRPVDVLPVFDEREMHRASQEASLRAQDEQLATALDQLPKASPEASEKLARLEAITRDLGDENLGADERRALGARRDEILADTTPEQLQVQAAPGDQARVIENQRARIAEQLAAIEAQRTQETAGRILQTPPFDAATLAHAQRQLYRNGFARGIPQSEFDAARQAIYSPTQEKATAPEASSTHEPMPAQPQPHVNGQLATLERQHAALVARGVHLLPEEAAELDRTAGAVESSTWRRSAYEQAAQCLTEAGV